MLTLSDKKIKKILLILAVWLQFTHWLKHEGFICSFYPNVTAYLESNQKSNVIIAVDFVIGEYPKPAMFSERVRNQNARALYDFQRLCRNGLKREGVVAQLWYDYEKETLHNDITFYSWKTLNTTNEKPSQEIQIRSEPR